MRNIKRWATLCAGMAALSCSAADEQGAEQPHAQAQSEGVDGLVLNDLSIAGESIRFLEYQVADAEPTFMLQNRGFAYAKESVLDRLEREAGSLTLLETFYALAPVGVAPHADLVRLHDEEVVGLGREDAAVRHVSFDVNRPIEKSATACNNYATANAWPNDPWVTPSNVNVDKPAGGNVGRTCRAEPKFFNGCDVLGHESQFVGTCNDGPGDVIVFDEWRTNSTGWTRDNVSIRLGAGQVIGWRFHNTHDLLHTQLLGITNTDDPDFLSPAYYVRARGGFP